MGIYFDAKNKVFHLQGKDTSYAFEIFGEGYLAHLYWGRKVRTSNLNELVRLYNRAFTPNQEYTKDKISLDTIPQEYPSYGSTDFRDPAFHVQRENGSTVSDLRYESHKIYSGKPALKGLPHTYAVNSKEAETLEVSLYDKVSGLKAVLCYTVFEDYNVITRSVSFENLKEEKLKLIRALSMSIDFPRADYDMLQLSGAWARERHVVRRKLASGGQYIESRRGASSPQQNPFIALLGSGADEDCGEVFGFNFVYSGNFLAQAEVDHYGTTRVAMGINPFDFSWLLEPGESFQAPEVVMVYSHEGIGDMSRTYHKFYRNNLCRGEFKHTARPVMINNWEATYFNFNADKIEAIAKAGKELGIELMVLDDGWFGKRDADNSSLGDWFVDRNKLPRGLDDLAGKVNGFGMKFGLWFEPEMVSPDSDLYRAHPDWCLHIPDRQRSEARNQLVLDMSREEVRDAVIKMVCDVLSSAPISYVKWDMNRHMTEIGSAALPSERQRETAHRYMLGVYRTMEEITSRFPHILFESCSGGGGRFDAGMLYYMPQTWTSDDTDAVERLYIQYGTSMVYPAISMGSHVSAVPNHQVDRITPLETRGNAAMSGNFGYELDLTRLAEEEKNAIKSQVEYYKEIRELIQFGDMYRLLNPFEGNEAAWMFVKEDKTEAIVFYFKVLAKPNPELTRLKLKGLEPGMDYALLQEDKVYGGDELMYVGLNVPELKGDYQSKVWRFVKR